MQDSGASFSFCNANFSGAGCGLRCAASSAQTQTRNARPDGNRAIAAQTRSPISAGHHSQRKSSGHALHNRARSRQQLRRFFQVRFVPQPVGIRPRPPRQSRRAIDVEPIRRIMPRQFAQPPIDSQRAKHLQISARIRGVGIQQRAIPIEKNRASRKAAKSHETQDRSKLAR